jgi:DHA1 family inner membrane transport protein
MPRAVYVLALGIFAMVTSEFVVAGLMPQMADGLNATVPQIGFLITAFAVAMAAGGPFLTVAVMRLPPRTALMTLFGVFLAGHVLAATATGYTTMLAARVVTGIASQAFFGVTMNPAMVTRVQRTGNAGPLVNTVHSSFITLGVILGSSLGAVAIDAWGLRSPLWLGAGLALLGLGTLLPDVSRRGGRSGTPAGSTPRARRPVRVPSAK